MNPPNGFTAVSETRLPQPLGQVSPTRLASLVSMYAQSLQYLKGCRLKPFHNPVDLMATFPAIMIPESKMVSATFSRRISFTDQLLLRLLLRFAEALVLAGITTSTRSLPHFDAIRRCLSGWKHVAFAGTDGVLHDFTALRTDLCSMLGLEECYLRRHELRSERLKNVAG